MNNTTTTTAKAKEVLEIKVSIKELKKEELIKCNELSTLYLKECYSIIKDITVNKDKFKAIRDFKANLLNKISDNDKILNTVLITLNKALKNSNETTLNLLKLSTFETVSKFAKLSNSNQKKVNETKDLTNESLFSLVSELLKSQNKETKEKQAKKLLQNNGYKVQ